MVRVALIQAQYSDEVFGREKRAKGVNPPLGLHSLKAYNKDISDIKVFDGETYEDYQAFLEDISTYRPDIIGVTTLSHSFKKSRELARHFVDKALLIAGGPYATFRDKECLEDFDIVVRGEGEETLREILQGKPLSDINGISYKDGRQIVRTSPRVPIRDLDLIPVIEWEDTDFDYYSKPSVYGDHLSRGYIMTSRGCSSDCGYCCSDIMWKGVRFRSPENVIREIKTLNESYGIDYIKFWDDTFTLRPDGKLQPIINALKDRGISYCCNARADTITEKKIKVLADSGCDRIFYGIESAVSEIREELGRRMTTDQMRRAFELTKEQGIKTVGSFIFGSPSETKEDIEATISFAIELNPDKVLFNVLAPHPGTPIYNFAVEQGIIDHFIVDTDRWVGEPLGIPTISRNLTREELQKLKFEAYREFYGRSEFLVEQLKKCKSLDDILDIENIAKTYL